MILAPFTEQNLLHSTLRNHVTLVVYSGFCCLIGQVPLSLLCCRGIYHVASGDKYQIAILIVTHHRLCIGNNLLKYFRAYYN